MGLQKGQCSRFVFRIPSQQQEIEMFHSPRFFLEPSELFPTTDIDDHPTEELRSQYMLHIQELNELISVKNVSSWYNLLRVQAFILMYVKRLKLKVIGGVLVLGPLTKHKYNGSLINKRSPIYLTLTVRIFLEPGGELI